LQSQDAVAVRADLAKAAAELRARDTAMAFAQTAYDRAVRLLELKAMSRQDVERARVERESAIAMQSQAQAEVERARMTLGQLGVDPESGTLVIRAPIAGVVLGRDAVPGSVVSAGTPLVTVTDPATLWLEIAATERLATSLRSGSTVRFTVQELGGSTFEAVVQGVAGALDPATRTLPVRAVVHNTLRRLRPEMFATVRVEESEARAAVSVPDDAIQLLDERPVVFIARPDGKGGVRLERRDIELGARVNGRTQVLSGIAATEVIVIEGAFAVKSEFARAKMPSEG
jgi:cobalt-zinc-cadmium efflux system membrane fusion protein